MKNKKLNIDIVPFMALWLTATAGVMMGYVWGISQGVAIMTGGLLIGTIIANTGGKNK